ncbi:MAG: nucleotidyltransferase family protein [Patescibacteria group bacterium]|nr:nucleotidyltransferase family protein [Patescibacteria group bacterium]
MKKDLINLLDKQIDREKLRNRSQAIEYFLSQLLLPKVTKVLILAGGEGVKFRPLTYEMPKALIPIKEKPLLEYTLENLKKYNFSEIVISIGHLGRKIKEYFKDGKKFGLNISYLVQEKKTPGTAQPVKQAEKILKNETFFLIYGDVLAEIDYQDLLNFHQSHHGIVTMALASVDRPSDWGVAEMRGNLITNFLEKPKEKIRSHLVNAGIFVCQPEIFRYLRKNSERLEKDVFPILVREKKLYGYPFEGEWADLSTPEIYEEVLKNFQYCF